MAVAQTLRIGSFTFDVLSGSHSAIDQALGPEGDFDFSMTDWSEGFLGIEEGIEYKPNMRKFVHAEAVDTAFPGQALLQTIATLVAAGSGAVIGQALKQLDFVPSGGTVNTYLVQTSPPRVLRLATVAGQYVWTVVGSGAEATDAIVHGDKLVVAKGTAYEHSATGTSFTNVATAADRFGRLGANIWRAVRPNSIFSASDVTGSWTSSSSIGDSYRINSLTSVEQVLCIGKEDGVYSLDADGFSIQFAPELAHQAYPTMASVQAVAVFNGDYYFATERGMIQIAAGDGLKRRIGIDTISSPSLATPTIKMLTSDDRYLYALMATGATQPINILRRSQYGQWHPFWTDNSDAVKRPEHVAVSRAMGFPALFFSYNDGANYITRYIRLPTLPNKRQESNITYDYNGAAHGSTLGAHIRLPRVGVPGARLTIDRATVQSESLGSSSPLIRIFSAVDGSSPTGNFTAFDTSPVQTRTLTTPITGNFIDFFVQFDSGTPPLGDTVTAVLKGFSIKGFWKPGYRKIHTFVIPADLYHTVPRGGRIREDPQTTLSNLNTLLNTNGFQACVDENGQSFDAVVTNVQRTMVKFNPDEEASHAVKITLVERSSS